MSAKSLFFLFVIIICLVLLTSYAFIGTFEFYRLAELAVKGGSLNIQGVAPKVIGIFLSQGTEYLCSDTVPGNCPMNGNGGGTRATTVNAIVERLTGDCDSGVTVNAYVCNFTVAVCNPQSSPAPDYSLTSGWSAVKWGPGNIYCNYTNTFNLDYFKHYGAWTINVSAVAGTFRNDTRSRWYYNEFNYLDYPYPGGASVPLGTVNAFAWNFGVGANTTRNIGNIRLNISYNATDFTGPGGTIDVHDGNFTVQNVTGPASPFTNVNSYENMSSSDSIEMWFHPSGGMKRCGNSACNQDENGGTYPNNLANYTLWWSVYVPSILAGLYQNTIYVNSYMYYKQG
jgi:hypothetical protein